MNSRIILFLCVFVLSFYPTSIFAAEYLGYNIDGEIFDATAYSYSTGRYYDVQVEFDGSQALIHFANGGYIVVDLDNEEIDDPHDISAYDYRRGSFWDLDVEGLD